ncbi:MAG: DUF2914 domain-containing protein [Gammaproteobacteria bacterium]|nr:DUF2914 domain-containing protein [Gammaproteobacteria bacterium]
MNKIFSVILIFITTFLTSQAWAGEVSRAQFTTKIQDREPVDIIVTLSTDQTQVSYFSELNDLSGKKITHQWIYKDKVMFEKMFQVGGARWRVWSSKTLQPGWTGQWTVITLDEDRTPLLKQIFEYR